jgi:hypothetical protein
MASSCDGTLPGTPSWPLNSLVSAPLSLPSHFPSLSNQPAGGLVAPTDLISSAWAAAPLLLGSSPPPAGRSPPSQHSFTCFRGTMIQQIEGISCLAQAVQILWFGAKHVFVVMPMRRKSIYVLTCYLSRLIWLYWFIFSVIIYSSIIVSWLNRKKS